VRELIATHSGQFLDHVGGKRFFQHLHKPVFGEIVDQPRKLVERELPPDRRSDRQGLVTGLGEALEPPPDHLTCTFGDARAPPFRRAERLRRQRSLFRQEPNDLTDEERVAFGLRMQGAHESLVRHECAGGLDEAFNVLMGETT